ncbi:hypothetical protein GTNG_0738 [Geobacillus thermodenitrificans NG80-2]|uniref:Uncharacterized protein n=1 Tax=Geobacillus thermodenitrificans (strain NG80-2) TaxID=420246 RepID=A4ILB4_GEOTN|nr:hypothetical protein GTNG_0738 [Geobacillus thermodenitrificans NG80-2]
MIALSCSMKNKALQPFSGHCFGVYAAMRKVSRTFGTPFSITQHLIFDLFVIFRLVGQPATIEHKLNRNFFVGRSRSFRAAICFKLNLNFLIRCFCPFILHDLILLNINFATVARLFG